jgi:hypothetical protein
MYKFSVLFILLFITMNFSSLRLMADESHIAMRGEDRSFDTRGGEHNDFNRNDENRNSFDKGAVYGADRGAGYGAAYGAGANANANNGAVPVNPDAAEQNMLYYSGMQSMGQK